MRSAHYTHKHIEKAGEGLNTACLYLILAGVFAMLYMAAQPDRTSRKHHREPESDVVGSISETDYLIAVSSAKQKAPPLTRAQLDEMDRQASLQTRPEDVAKLKPKAKAAYYATLKRSVWNAVE